MNPVRCPNSVKYYASVIRYELSELLSPDIMSFRIGRMCESLFSHQKHVVSELVTVYKQH